MELALTGDLYPAERIAQLGLLSRVVPKGQALAAALELAERIAQNAPLAVVATKQVLIQSADWTEEEAWAAQRKLARTALTSQDAREGASAFAEKRAPVWQGH